VSVIFPIMPVADWSLAAFTAVCSRAMAEGSVVVVDGELVAAGGELVAAGGELVAAGGELVAAGEELACELVRRAGDELVAAVPS